MNSRARIIFVFLLIFSLSALGWRLIKKNAEAHRTAWVLPSPYITTALAFSPDSETLAAGEGSHPPTLRIWKWRTMTLLQDIKTEHNAAITEVTFSADGRTVTTCGADDGWLRVWNVSSGKQVRAWTSQGAIKSVAPVRATSRSGSLVAFPRAGGITMQDRKSRRILGSFKTRETEFHALAFSPNDKWLAGSAIRKVYVWKVETQR